MHFSRVNKNATLYLATPSTHSRLDRDVHWYLTLQEGGMSVAEGEDSLDGTLERLSLATFLAA